MVHAWIADGISYAFTIRHALIILLYFNTRAAHMIYLYPSYPANATTEWPDDSFIIFGYPSRLRPSLSRTSASPAYNAAVGWTRTYYDPSFCPFAARNKHLLRHHVKWEERWRGAIDVDCRGTFLPHALSRRIPFLVHSGRFSLSTVYRPEERNGGTFSNGGKPPSHWTGIQARWQEDVVRAIALCPNEGPLIFTSDGSKWSKWREGGRGQCGWMKHQGNEPVKSACGTRQRFASLYPFPNLRHFYSHPSLRGRLHPRNSLGCSRRTFLARHAICTGGDFRRDKVKIRSAHLMEQMVNASNRIYRRKFRSMSTYQYIRALYNCRFSIGHRKSKFLK